MAARAPAPPYRPAPRRLVQLRPRAAPAPRPHRSRPRTARRRSRSRVWRRCHPRSSAKRLPAGRRRGAAAPPAHRPAALPRRRRTNRAPGNSSRNRRAACACSAAPTIATLPSSRIVASLAMRCRPPNCLRLPLERVASGRWGSVRSWQRPSRPMVSGCRKELCARNAWSGRRGTAAADRSPWRWRKRYGWLSHHPAVATASQPSLPHPRKGFSPKSTRNGGDRHRLWSADGEHHPG